VIVTDTLRIVVAEDDFLVREGIRHVLREAEDEFELAAVCEDYDTLLRAIEQERPHVVLTDIRMPPTNTDEGIRIATHLRETAPHVGVVVLSQYASPSYALRLLEHGSEGRAYLLKERIAHRIPLFAAIREVAAGGSVIDPKVVEALVTAREQAKNSPLTALTPREREVLGELAQGQSNAAIAESVFLTKRGVEKHVNSIFGKLGLPPETTVSRRVVATLLYLADTRTAEKP
jgi:DNA-binding NarL/FixJ family response regulator